MISDSPIPPDPLAQVVALLRPEAAFSKLVIAGGQWAVRRTDAGQPFYCVVLEGRCRLMVEHEPPLLLEAGDFALAPAAGDFMTSSLVPPPHGSTTAPIPIGSGTYRLREAGAAPTVRLLVGHCTFGAETAGLLAPLLPRLLHVRGERRLTVLIELLNEEARAERPGRASVLSRLVELLLIEALRFTTGPMTRPGLLRGLADPQLAAALRGMHDQPSHGWTATALASQAAMSRSTFFERFQREVGVAPMAYLLGWRMTLAKAMLDAGGERLARVAQRVGYGSVSTFSTAFARQFGHSPARYTKLQRRAATDLTLS